jgi:amylosucrase
MLLRKDKSTIEGRIYQNMKRLIELRQSKPVFSGGELQVIQTGNASVLGYLRSFGSERALVFANVSEGSHTISANLLRLYGLSYSFEGLLQNTLLPFADVTLEPYQFICLAG